MLKKLKQWLSQKTQPNANKLAKMEQLKHVGVLVVILAGAFAFYRFSETPNQKVSKADAPTFDGVFDSHFNQGSDEALLEKQQHQIDEIKALVTNNAKNQQDEPNAETKVMLSKMQEKLSLLEEQNKQTNEQLQVALLENAQQKSKAIQPPTREEMAERLKQKQQAERDLYAHAGLETVHFKDTKKDKFERHTANNYVWAGTFVEGVLLTGIIGDAGINGSKNMGTAMIRLTSNGIMPNEQRSRLEGCFVLVSSYGDLSGSSVVLHLETISCAGKVINFEQKAYGSVFDLDAMQDLRGTSILKTKPLLSYTAAAGALAGIGDGLKNYGIAQTVNPGAGTVTLYGTGQAIAQSAAGGALSNPANRISDYVMRIADIYHPLVVARAGRRVSVLFTKGFWIDKAHQVYESDKAIDDNQSQAQRTPDAVSAVSEFNSVEQPIAAPITSPLHTPEQEFIQQQTLPHVPTMSPVEESSHD